MQMGKGTISLALLLMIVGLVSLFERVGVLFGTSCAFRRANRRTFLAQSTCLFLDARRGPSSTTRAEEERTAEGRSQSKTRPYP